MTPSTPDTHARPIIDRDLAVSHRLRWAQRDMGRDANFLHAYSAEELVDRITVTKRQFDRCALVDDRSDHLSARLRGLSHVRGVVAMAPDASLLSGDRLGIVAEEEAFPFEAGSLDLVMSNLTLQLTNDTPGTLIQIRRALKPDGLFSAALLGGETLLELRQSLLAAEAELSGGVSPRVVPFPDIRDLGALLQRAGFALPVTDTDRLTVRYATLFDLMTDLRAMGWANMLSERTRKPTTKSFFIRAAEIYAERFSDPDGRIRATFDFIYLSGWAPHESQQEPARRGSAEVSMKDVLSPGGPV
ncbi:methyltransferase domain-containing protein [Fulvimarina endophytica]|uniref:Methyltransferase domain-containing protein n=1 Tax=Fulvimarina endophytica TaxID=2293836 RepID=A0A371XAQ5_9HYPH|nr:methyltransferase domain-containing protein [Fulvimarina endophytica]RFC66317.1 methyltransferase domain-containing protein [Fulvimarina endophytica]